MNNIGKRTLFDYEKIKLHREHLQRMQTIKHSRLSHEQGLLASAEKLTHLYTQILHTIIKQIIYFNTPTKIANRQIYNPKDLEIKRENQCLVKRMQEIESLKGGLNPSKFKRPSSAESMNRNFQRKQFREVIQGNMELLSRLKKVKSNIKALQRNPYYEEGPSYSCNLAQRMGANGSKYIKNRYFLGGAKLTQLKGRRNTLNEGRDTLNKDVPEFLRYQEPATDYLAQTLGTPVIRYQRKHLSTTSYPISHSIPPQEPLPPKEPTPEQQLVIGDTVSSIALNDDNLSTALESNNFMMQTIPIEIAARPRSAYTGAQTLKVRKSGTFRMRNQQSTASGTTKPHVSYTQCSLCVV